jgi:TonB family protein
VPDGFSELCTEILNHAKQLYSASTVTCSSSPDEPDAQDSAIVERIRVGGNVQAAALLKRVTPTYPLEAKSRGIQGVVRFEAVINKEGKVESLVLLSGPLALYKSARDAVSQWEYRPTQLNGRPVQVLTWLEVNYTLSAR